ncbi:fasciclin domain-containing protein [Thalassotalea crassostreae]|uniref:fasciclin domain-containing protein n=1 Tax=Thalassotalea crassostreae TaxID=1763536 RepID=UPI0009EF4E5C|nr:fasciclin domain-containing protein [Thalassotalea crassostreae]
MKGINKIILPLMMASVITACGSDSDNDISDDVVQGAAMDTTIVDAAVDNGNFTTLVAALEATGLDAVLDDPDSTYTVFAPTDAAFALLGDEAINNLLDDPDKLSDILLYHVIPGEVPASAAISSAGSTVQTANEDFIGLSLDGDSLLVNTVTVTATDIMTDNGIIHVIDAVLIPPEDMVEPTANIVDTAVAAGSFTTLVAALQATGLDAVLSDESATYTVFAPTDDAFALIGDETIDTLLANTDVLSDILLQHVVSGAAVNSITAYSLNGTMVDTASPAKVNLKINSVTDMLMFGGANIVMKDIYTTNGVIHVIDAVVIGDVDVPAPAMSLVDVAVDNGNFTVLATALQATGLDQVLADLDTDYTVFAPTDAAFAKLPEGEVERLLNDAEALSNILLYHVLSGEVMSDGAISVAQSMDNQVTMANGDKVALSFADSMLFVNGAKISAADVMADNGVIHVIDNVILPPEMKDMPDMSIVEVALADENFSTLVAALTAANLVDTLANEEATFTVFAPTNDAFAKIDADVLDQILGDTDALSALLLQHVVAGAEIDSVSAYAENGKMLPTVSEAKIDVMIDADTGMLMIGGANVVKKDIYTTNGVIHVIDTVIVGDLDIPEPRMSLVDVAVANGNFTTLVAALKATGLDMVLDDLDTDYTVFAPTDAAFAKLPEGKVDELLADIPALTDILLYHVLANEVMASDAITTAQSISNTVMTANGDKVALSYMDPSLYVNNAMVTAADVGADNGVIHVVDTVIMPPKMKGMPTDSIADIAVATDELSTLVTALAAANLVETLDNDDAMFTVFAPTNAAFAAIDPQALADLLEDTDALTSVLLTHVVADAEIDSVSAYAANGEDVTTVNNKKVSVAIDSDTRLLTIGGANVVIKDIYATNGVVHVIDTVILN